MDLAAYFLTSNYLVKGGVLMVLFWWGWFRPGENQSTVRTHLVSTMGGCFLAMALARILASALPFRARPIHTEKLNFIFPHGIDAKYYDGWSSFPSDHAVLFFTISTGIFYISRRAGLITMIYTSVFIALPRVYLGFHYPSDIIAGAFIGVIIALSVNTAWIIKRVSAPISAWISSKPELGYPLLFLITYQIVDMFNSSRHALRFAKRIFEIFVS